MNSDSGLEKDALSYDSHFSFKMNKKKLNLKKPNPPPCTFKKKNPL